MDRSDLGDQTSAFVPLAQGMGIGPYRLIRQLGIGGMGQVFLAEDSRLERQVALKFLTPQYATQPEFRLRFMREAKSAAKLSHRNIVTVYEVGEATDHVYIAMEYVDGRTLRQLIDTRGLDYTRLLDAFLQLCLGLQKAHENGVVHRDLKPSNIMVTGDHQVKILDFGLAKGIVDDNLTGTGAALGTVNYMSPEQAQGIGADHRSDIFSVGIVLFELLTGVNPFVRGHMPATIHAVVFEPVGQISAYNSEVPPDWQIVVEKALGKKPADRYQSIGDLLADIEMLNAGVTIAPAKVAQPAVDASASPALAILHLRNLGAADDDFLTYGITEDLIVDLSKLGGVRVTPMRRILKFKDSDLELEELARQLNVNMILDGSIKRTDSAVRISAQLIDVTRDKILWSERWEESLASLPQIKLAFAKGIGAALEVDSSVIRKADFARAETSNANAYDFYLKGKYAFQRRQNSQDVESAFNYYNEALKLQPYLIEAQVGIAEIHTLRLEFGKATAILEPALVEAQKRNLKADEARVRTVLGIAANRTNRFEESIEHLRTAAKLFRELGDTNGECWALSELLAPLYSTQRLNEVVGFEKQLGEFAQQGADPLFLTRGLEVVADAHYQLNDPLRSKILKEEALQLARANDLKPMITRLLIARAMEHSVESGKLIPEAMTYLEEARLHAEKLEDKALLAKVDFSTAILEMMAGAFRISTARIEKLLPELEAALDYTGASNMTLNTAQMHYFMGRYDECLGCVEPLLTLSKKQTGNWQKYAQGLAKMVAGRGEFGNGNLDRAIRELEDGAALLKASGEQTSLGLLFVWLGEVYYFADRKSEASACLKEAYLLSVWRNDLETVPIAAGYLALIEVETGDPATGIRELTRLVESSEGHYNEVMVRRLLGRALVEHGADDKDRQEGKRQLLHALGLARKMEFVIELKRIQAILDHHN